MLTRAHEREFGKISKDNKPIWQIAEEREQNKANNIENQPLVNDINDRHKALDHWFVFFDYFEYSLLFMSLLVFVFNIDPMINP